MLRPSMLTVSAMASPALVGITFLALSDGLVHPFSQIPVGCVPQTGLVGISSAPQSRDQKELARSPSGTIIMPFWDQG